MREYELSIDGKKYKAEVKNINNEGAVIVVNDEEYHVELEGLGTTEQPMVREISRPAPTAGAPVPAQSAAPAAPSGGAGAVLAPLPGQILELHVKEGDAVKAGQNLLVMEAMKMENNVQANTDGTVEKLYVQAGQSVAEGDALVEIRSSAMTTM